MFLRNCWHAAGWSRDFAPEALNAVTNRSPDSKMLTIAIDSGVAQFRRMMDDAMLAERQNGAATAAAGR